MASSNDATTDIAIVHDVAATRRWPDDPHASRVDADVARVESSDPAQLTLDPLLAEAQRRLRGDVAFARAILEAMIAHEPIAIRALLATPAALRLPRPVREEAQLFARLSRHSLRAPMQALQHHHRMVQLAVSGRSAV